MHAKQVSAKQEDYLEAILGLVGARGAARVRDIAAGVAVHKSTVTATLRSLRAKGLVNYTPYEFVTLTARGKQVACAVASRHGAIKGFLTNVLMIEEGEAGENACRMEHVMDARVLDRLAKLASFAKCAEVAWAGAFRRYLAGSSARGRSVGQRGNSPDRRREALA